MHLCQGRYRSNAGQVGVRCQKVVLRVVKITELVSTKKNQLIGQLVK
jgi:hypothetical protein